VILTSGGEKEKIGNSEKVCPTVHICGILRNMDVRMEMSVERKEGSKNDKD